MKETHHNFMTAAFSVAQWSTTRGDKVGSVLVTPKISLMDRCDFPEGIMALESRYEKPDWFIWADHAERRVIYSAARYGVATEGCTIYTTWFPCVECAKAISQSGIKTVIGIEPDWNNKRWNFLEARQILKESNIDIEFYRGEDRGKMFSTSRTA